MNTLSISKIVRDAWELFKQHFSSILVIFVVYTIVSGILSLTGLFMEGSNIVASILYSFIKWIISTILSLGLYRVFLDLINGEEAKINRLFSQTNPKLIFHLIVGSIIVMFAVIAGLFFLVIPGIYFAFRLQFFTLVLLEQDEPNFSEALKTSWDMTEGHVLDLLSLAIISFFIIIAGFLALFLGIFIAIPVVFIMNILVYRKLQVQHSITGEDEDANNNVTDAEHRVYID